MRIKERLFKTVLITRGRKTGREHSVMLRAVNHEGRIYFSRHRPDGDWFRNAVADPDVKIRYNDEILAGRASQVNDEEMCKKISMLKYPGEARAHEKRVTIEVTLNQGARM